MPDHIDDLVRAFGPVMRDTRNAPARAAGPGDLVIDLADDRVLGAHGLGNRGDRCDDGGPTPVRMDRPQFGWRLRHRQLGCEREKLCHRIELTVIDIGRIPVHQIAEGRPVGYWKSTHETNDSRCAQADRMSLACSMSVVGGIANTIRSAP
jgi:hypothetical protein